MSQMEITKSIELLEKDWDIDPIIKDFHLGKRDDVTENSIKVKDVIFHIPFLNKIKKFHPLEMLLAGLFKLLFQTRKTSSYFP